MKTYKFSCNKLIRDKTIERMSAKNITCHYRIANATEYLAALKAKLIEEAAEVKDTANRQELIDEMVDVVEVLRALCQTSDISLEELEQRRNEVKSLRGGFAKKIYCEFFEVPHDSPDAEYFKKNSHKYPEIE